MKDKTIIMELKNGKYLACCVCEISSVPSVKLINSDRIKALEENAEMFYSMLNELYSISGINSSTFELLWVTKKADTQSYNAEIHLYLIIRIIKTTERNVNNTIKLCIDNVIDKLEGMLYEVRIIDYKSDELFNGLIDGIRRDKQGAIIKSEKLSINSGAMLPYYCSSVFNRQNTEDFSGIALALSRHPNSALSIQLIPTAFKSTERYFIEEMASSYAKLFSGVSMGKAGFFRDSMAQQPYEYYKYYSNEGKQPLYTYNFLVFGDSSACADLAGAVESVLRRGNQDGYSTDVRTVNISSLKIDIKNQLEYYPWNVNNKLISHFRDKRKWSAYGLNAEIMRMPYIMTAMEGSVLFRLPVGSENIIAINTNTLPRTTEQMSSKVTDKANIKFGTLVRDKRIVVGCPEKAFTRHALIVGTPGSGKTTFSINLLLQFAERKIPFLAIEPTKTEYRAMIDAVPELQIFTPGNNDVSPFVINPFIPPKGIRLEQYIPSLASAFKAAFSMPSPLDTAFLKAIRACYTEYGWRDYSTSEDENVIPFGMHEFLCVFKKMIKNMNYSQEVKGNLESGGILRLSALIDQNKNIYDTVRTVPIEDLIKRPTVLELNAIDNSEQKALLMALLLINICLYTKHNNLGDGELKNIILIDEAHVLLGISDKESQSQTTTVKALQDMIAEIRSYGTSIIIADQAPTKVTREVVANTDIKISFRLVQEVEKELIADSTGMDDINIQQLSSLNVGEAFFYFMQMRSPQIIVTEDIRKQAGIRLSVSDEETKERNRYWREHRDILKPFLECGLCKFCEKGCNFKLRSDADYYSDKLYSLCADRIKTVDDLKSYAVSIPQLAALEEELSMQEKNQLIDCMKIRFIRRFKIEKDITLKLSEIKQVIEWNK